MNKGLLFVLTGASSVGKKDIRDRLLGDGQLHLNYSISMTTRPKRGEEVDGRDYYFVNHEAFAQALRNRELLEYTEFDGYYYGTPKHQVDFLLNSGKNVMVEVEAQGWADQAAISGRSVRIRGTGKHGGTGETDHAAVSG